MSRVRRLSIRQLIGLLVVGAVVVAGLLFRVTTLQLDNAGERREAQLDRLDDLGLGEEVSASADDLTRMAHLYVSTGDPRYRRYHQEILDIRAGEAPRPERYDAGFWEAVIAEGKGEVEYGEPAALAELARREELTPDEQLRLEDAIGSSDRLARLERTLMSSVAASPGDGVEAEALVDAADEHARLTSAGYEDRRLEIESAVDEFSATVAGRTAARVAALEARRDDLLLARAVILAVLGLVVAAALYVTARWIVGPLRRLTGVTRRIATGQYGERTEAGGVSELAQLADDFNQMADAIQRDIARRKEAERAAESADRAKSDFLAVMSHELRTPMVGVSGTLDVLARTDLAPDQRELVEISRRSAASMLEIIGEVLDMSKIEAGKLVIAPATVSLRNALEDVVTQYRQAASEAGLVLSLEVDGRLAAAHVLDAERLRQVIANLVSNAVKFTPSGTIEIHAQVLDDDREGGIGDSPPEAARGDGPPAGRQRVGIAVADTGIGIPEANQRELFKPFTQVDAGATRRVGGTGLGLVISREITEMMGGELTIESSPGAGTTARVSLELPVGDPEEIVAEPSPDAEAPLLARPLPGIDEAEREGSLLLLVEDHPVNRTVMLTQLEAIGLRAETAADGVEALERMRERSYGVVLADIHMPNMDGYELARRIRSREAETGAGRTPVLAVTASALHGELERCQDAGMDDLITKPTTIAVLAQRLRRRMPYLAWSEPEPAGVEAAAASNPEPADDGEPLDRELLDEMTGGDAELAAGLLSDFVASTRSDLLALERALDAGERDGVRREAHRIVGASRMVGAVALTRAAERLQARAPDADASEPELRELARGLAAELDRIAARAGS